MLNSSLRQFAQRYIWIPGYRQWWIFVYKYYLSKYCIVIECFLKRKLQFIFNNHYSTNIFCIIINHSQHRLKNGAQQRFIEHWKEERSSPVSSQTGTNQWQVNDSRYLNLLLYHEHIFVQQYLYINLGNRQLLYNATCIMPVQTPARNYNAITWRET